MDDLIGKFAISKAGHDKDTIYVVLSSDKRFAYLCDGKYHTLTKPKKKALKHMALCRKTVSEELQQRMLKNEQIFDYEIKYAIKMQNNGKEEGYVKE